MFFRHVCHCFIWLFSTGNVLKWGRDHPTTYVRAYYNVRKHESQYFISRCARTCGADSYSIISSDEPPEAMLHHYAIDPFRYRLPRAPLPRCPLTDVMIFAMYLSTLKTFEMPTGPPFRSLSQFKSCTNLATGPLRLQITGRSVAPRAKLKPHFRVPSPVSDTGGAF